MQRRKKNFQQKVLREDEGQDKLYHESTESILQDVRTLVQSMARVFFVMGQMMNQALCEMCLNTDFFWSVFSRIQTEYGEILIQFQFWKIRTRKNSVFGHFSHSEGVPYNPSPSHYQSSKIVFLIILPTVTKVTF